MAREHPQFLQSEIKSYLVKDASTIETDLEIFKKRIIRTFMDTVDGGSPRYDYDSHLIREYNKKCDELGKTAFQITPINAGNTYTGNFDGIPPLPSSPTNQILNPDFTGNRSQSTATPGDYSNLIINFNGHPIGPGATNLDNVQMSGWYFHSPMHISTNNYSSIMLGNLFSKEAYNLVSTGQLLGYGDADQPRVLKLFGQGDRINAPGSRPSYNQDLDRLMVDGAPFETPITCMGNTNDPAASVDNSLQTGFWTRYDVCYNFGGKDGFTPSIPGGTTGISFGCYVKVESNDQLRDLNFGGVYIKQITGTNYQTNHHTFMDILQVKGSGFTQNPSLVGTTNYALNSQGVSGCFNWGNGRAAIFFGGGQSSEFKLKEDFPRKTSARVLDSKLQSEAFDWVLLSGETPYLGGDFNLALWYGENHSYLNGDGVPAGAVHFSQPFVYFKS